MTTKKIPTGREVHFSPVQCEIFYQLLNNVGAKDAGGLRYTLQIADLIKSVGSVRNQKKLDEREKFAREYRRVLVGEEGDAEREKINEKMLKWLDENKLTNECFPTGPKTIPITIPPESDTVLLNMLLFHSRLQRGGGIVQIVELCEKFELREEFQAEAEKLDNEDKKKTEKET